ncbi:response regulator [Inconstantimicrobium mannanitabidum]|uniref:DNA-binding response regulator n=1 Tax=Inconstantimicrobium mannanitabidum TaxID=1604901 RepID=A0ACB5R7U1_9CLOT|nr:response regulator [Clostridium sp. TW13]GKX65026.1 DNA-binding response regulator [Clostridium sp. TW13]
MNIIIVDDDKLIRAGMRKIIERAGTEFIVVGEASNGAIALDMIIKNPPDVIITDIKMPVMDGIELIKQLKSYGIKSKIIALSGFDEYKFVRETLKNGASDYLLKPVNNQDFITMLQDIKRSIEKEVIDSKQYEKSIKMSNNIIQTNALLQIISGKVSENDSDKNLIGNIDVSDFQMVVVSTKILQDKSSTIKMYIEANSNNFYDFAMMCEYENENEVIIVYSNQYEEVILKILDSLVLNNREIIYSIQSVDNDIQRAYKICCEKLLDGFYGDANVNLNSYSTVDKQLIEEMLDKLVAAIELSDKTKFGDEFQALIKFGRDNKIKPEMFKNALIKLIDLAKFKIEDFSNVYDDKEAEGISIKEYIRYAKQIECAKAYILNYFHDVFDKIKVLRDSRSERMIEFVKEYIRENYNKDISLTEVAGKVYLNPNYFSDLFKRKVGKNFLDYLLELRIEISKELLKKPGIKVYEVANEVGYKEHASFNRAFKRIVGISPKEYMNLIK